MNISEYFTSTEMACKGEVCCGGAYPMDSHFMHYLDLLRGQYKKKIYITSGFRCYTHNRTVGGVPTSWHPRGKAADCKPEGGKEDLKLLADIAELFFKEVIIYPTFVHIADPKPCG